MIPRDGRIVMFTMWRVLGESNPDLRAVSRRAYLFRGILLVNAHIYHIITPLHQQKRRISNGIIVVVFILNV